MPKPLDWALIKALFERCISLDGGETEQILRTPDISTQVAAEVRRLLTHHYGADRHFLEPLPSVRRFFAGHRLAEGDCLAGRFLIRHFVGSGGMGEVYAAEDLAGEGELVALKLVRTGLSSDVTAERRFEREWQVASSISHPNVCRLDELFQTKAGDALTGTFSFFSMEFVKGRTLAALLQEKKQMTFEETAAIASQLLSGLSHVHSLRVIHRDLKPSNIMLRDPSSGGDPAARVVIMDFGLARMETLPLSQQLSTAGDLLGTLAYLAPEQLQGAKATTRSDLYAFGLIIFEMLTGHLPFPNETSATVLLRVRARAPSLQRRGIPRRWAAVIDACLECNPSFRPESAAEVRQLLASNRGAPPLLYAQVHRRTVVATGATVVVAAAGAAIWRARLHTQRGVAVLIAESPSDSPARAALFLQLRAALAQSSYLTLWPPDKLQASWALMGRKPPAQPTEADWREIAFREGVPLALFVNTSEMGQATRIGVRVEDIAGNPEYPRRSWKHEYTAQTPAALLFIISEAAQWVRSFVGEAPSEIDASRVPPESVTTPSWRALVEYGSGEQALAASEYATALLKYDAALRFDPAFAMAWMRKGDVLFRVSNESEAFDAYRHALNSLKVRPLTRREDLRFRSMLMSDASDFAQAEKLFAEYFHYFPRDSYGPFYRALPLLLLGYIDEAIGSLKVAMSFPDREHRARVQLAWAYVSKGDHAGAEREIATLRQRNFRSEAAYAEAVLSYAAGDPPRTLAALAEAGRGASLLSMGTVRLFRVSVLAEAGQVQEAIGEALTNAEQDGFEGARASRTLNLLAAAYLLHYQGNRKQAVNALASIDEASMGFLQMRHAGTLYARCGLTARCKQLVDRMPVDSPFPRVSITKLRLLGELDLAAGRFALGLSHMRAAAALDVRAYGKEYLSYALWKTGQINEARTEYEACLKQRSFQLRIAEPEPAGFCLRAASQLHQLTSRS